MKNKIIFTLSVMLSYFLGNIYAQDVTTVEAKSAEISYNLDLEAVASIFGDSEDLEDFEKRLNEPEIQISNLDLNNDGFVDYLRVIETQGENVNLITIQAVLGDDIFQDVATIDVEKDESGSTKVQVVGNVYMYGENYIIEPVYVRQPVFFVTFWEPYYSPWRSPYYYGYYPGYYEPWRPYPPSRYRRNVHVHVNVRNTYHHTNVRTSSRSVELQREIRRNDYARKNPDKSFVKRNQGAVNKDDLLKSNNKVNTRTVNGKEVERRTIKTERNINESVERNNSTERTQRNAVKNTTREQQPESKKSVPQIDTQKRVPESNNRTQTIKTSRQKSSVPDKSTSSKKVEK